MPRQTPADLADEIRTSGGRWSLSFARFQPPMAHGARSFGVSIAISGGAFWSDIALDSRPLRDARSAVGALKHSGYEILSIRSRPFHARRPIRGLRELDAEVRRLEELSRDRKALSSFPSRVARPPGPLAGRGPFSMAAFERLRSEHGWMMESVSVGREGSAPPFLKATACSIGAWCYGDRDERQLTVLVHLFERRPGESMTDEEFGRLDRAFRGRFEPFGYLAVKFRGHRARHFAVLDKAVRTLSGVRRERERLDRLLFGD